MIDNCQWLRSLGYLLPFILVPAYGAFVAAQFVRTRAEPPALLIRPEVGFVAQAGYDHLMQALAEVPYSVDHEVRGADLRRS